jgi:hypothetical protein
VTDRTAAPTAAALDRAWARFATLGLGLAFATLAAGFALLLLLDPYDSGRFRSPLPAGVAEPDWRLANVSRGRDPRFAAAVLGNSHVQLIDPTRLTAATGLAFVQLAMPATGPREQMAVLAWFARHRPRVEAVVVGVDPLACRETPEVDVGAPFPYWLYGGDLDYALRLLNPRALGRLWTRVLIAAGWRTPDDPAGYFDYERSRSWSFAPDLADLERVPVADLTPRPMRGARFPGIDDLLAGLDALPRETRIVLLLPPVFATSLPRVGTVEARRMAGCKWLLAEAAAARPNLVVLDDYVDGPLARDPSNFMDPTHIRSGLARAIERRIADAIGARAAGSGPVPALAGERPAP